jgi:hypothetical protein
MTTIIVKTAYTGLSIPFKGLSELHASLEFTPEKPNSILWLIRAAKHAAETLFLTINGEEIWCDGVLVSRKSVMYIEDGYVFIRNLDGEWRQVKYIHIDLFGDY